MTRAREQKKEFSVCFHRKVVTVRYASRPLFVAKDVTKSEAKRLIEKMIDQDCVGLASDFYGVEASTDGDVASQREGGVSYEVVTDKVTAEVYPKQDEICNAICSWTVTRDMDGNWRLVD